jgi:Spy/CpxP family protein refolding chaperone
MKISCTLLGAGFAALAAMLMTADFADAGGRRGHGGRQGGAPEGHENRAEALGLTEDQTAQMQSLRESFRREAEALKGSGESTRQAFQALRESHREQAHAILTDEQRTQLQALRAEREANRPEDGHRGRQGQRPGLSSVIELSDDQESQIETLRGDFRTQVEALRASGEGSREQGKALFEAHREQVQALLTDEQLATLQEYRAQRETNHEGNGRRHGRGGHQGAVDDANETETVAAQKSAAAVETRSWSVVKSLR